MKRRSSITIGHHSNLVVYQIYEDLTPKYLSHKFGGPYEHEPLLSFSLAIVSKQKLLARDFILSSRFWHINSPYNYLAHIGNESIQSTIISLIMGNESIHPTTILLIMDNESIQPTTISLIWAMIQVFSHLVHTNIKELTWIFCQCKSWAPCWLLVVLACQVGNGSRESDSSMHSFTINNRVRSTQSQYLISFKGLWKYQFRYKVLSVDVQGLWKYQFRYKVLSVHVQGL